MRAIACVFVAETGVLQQASICDMILVHSNNLALLSDFVSVFFIGCKIGLTLSQLPSNMLSEYIRNHAPVIHQVRYGECLTEL